MNTHPTDLHAPAPDREKSTRAILEDAMANKPDPHALAIAATLRNLTAWLAAAQAEIEHLRGLLREAEPYTPQSFSGKPLLANRIQEALRNGGQS